MLQRSKSIPVKKTYSKTPQKPRLDHDSPQPINTSEHSSAGDSTPSLANLPLTGPSSTGHKVFLSLVSTSQPAMYTSIAVHNTSLARCWRNHVRLTDRADARVFGSCYCEYGKHGRRSDWSVFSTRLSSSVNVVTVVLRHLLLFTSAPIIQSSNNRRRQINVLRSLCRDMLCKVTCMPPLQKLERKDARRQQDRQT